MLSSVLRSKRAVQVDIAIMRTFVRVREILATHRDGAMVFLQAIALAATLDTGPNERVAGAIADEVWKRGIRDVLSPVVVIAEDVRGGRLEDTYGNDPYFASAIAHTFVVTFEKKGVVTTPKHFVANVAEGGCESYPTGMTERTLQERYFPSFDAAIEEAGARSVMTAYNLVGDRRRRKTGAC